MSLVPDANPPTENDPHFTKLNWINAEILPAPTTWSGLPEGKIPSGTHGFDTQGRPITWPLRLTNAHWAALLPGLPAGDYIFRCRTIDQQGHAQPLPRPFRKSGHAALETVGIVVQ